MNTDLAEKIYCYLLQFTKCSDFYGYAGGKYYIHFSYAHEADEGDELCCLIYAVGDKERNLICSINVSDELFLELNDLKSWYVVDKIPTKIPSTKKVINIMNKNDIEETQYSKCSYSNSDLQQIILDDKLLLDLIKNFTVHDCTYYGSGLVSGNGLTKDASNNFYHLYFDIHDNKFKFSIGKAVREFTLQEYRLWCNILLANSKINNLQKEVKCLEDERNKSIWRKFWNY